MAPTSRGGGGKLSRRAAIALIAGGGTLAISGTGAFTQAKTPRRFSVTTAADENALLGIKTLDVTFTETNNTKPIFKLTNRTNSTLSLDNLTVNPPNYLFLDYPNEIEPGNDWDEAVVTAYINKELTNDDPLEVEILAESDTTSITVVHTLEIKSELAQAVLDQTSTVVYAAGGEVNAIAGDGDKPQSLISDRVKALGAPTTDITGTGEVDLPYVTNNGSLKVTDSSGTTEKLVDKSAKSKANKSKTIMTAGSWNSNNPSVFYASRNKKTLYRVDGGGSVSTVAEPGNGVQGVVGIGDIDNDGAAELIFVDGSQQIRYLSTDGTIEKISGGGVGSNNAVGVGKVANFDDGVRVVFVNGSNNIKLVGSDTTVLSAANAKKSPVTVADVDGDNDLEIVYIGSDDGHLKYVNDPLSSPNISFLRDHNGKRIDADDKIGVVS